MLTFLIIILTILLMVDCLLLGLLVLIQLPKKEAGLGVAFGGGTTDALFGAGSGNALTKLTKYSAGAFFGLIIVLSMLQIHAKNEGNSGLRNAINSATVEPQTPAATTAPATATPPPATPSGSTTAPATASNGPTLLFNPAGNNVPTTGTNAPATPGK